MTTSQKPEAPLLEVRNLSTHFFTASGEIRAVNDVSFNVKHGEVLGLVGESGCGKSVTALSLMRLVPNPPGQIVNGEILLDGEDLLALPDDQMQHVRGVKIGMIFQEPMTSLNPVMTIGRQLTETLQVNLKMPKAAALDRAAELLAMVGIPDPKQRLKDYPHQLSGGQRQRVMIAIALSCNPRLLIADEATTALDVTIQAQILELLISLSGEFNTALLIITHNLGIVARYADRVNVMYAGKIREMGRARDIYTTPGHPYTVGLLRSVPRLDLPRTQKLDPIEGEIPDMTNLPPGCAFEPRCRYAIERCKDEEPPLYEAGLEHRSRCIEWQRVIADRTTGAGKANEVVV